MQAVTGFNCSLNYPSYLPDMTGMPTGVITAYTPWSHMIPESCISHPDRLMSHNGALDSARVYPTPTWPALILTAAPSPSPISMPATVTTMAGALIKNYVVSLQRHSYQTMSTQSTRTLGQVSL